MQISVQETAARLNVSTRRVRTLLAEGRIHGVQIGKTWVVTGIPSAVMKRKPGRPAKRAQKQS